MIPMVTKKLKVNIIAVMPLVSHRRATKIRARFKVTMCLYLSPSCRARSLSKLIVVSVVKETPQKNPLVMFVSIEAYEQMVESRGDIKYAV